MKKNFFKLLSAYAPTSQNKASYDEHVFRYAKRLGIDEINIDNGLLKKLIDKFLNNLKSIVISGSAGDGKTYLLRKLYENLNGDIVEWKNSYIPKLEYENSKIVFVKDFTEIDKKDKIEILEGLYKSIFEQSNILYIIAANDGVLTDTLREYTKQKSYFKELLELIENQIEDSNLETNLILLDLSQTSSAKNFELLLNEILNLCEIYENDCPSLSDLNLFCPIHSNIKLLKQKEIQKQLINIIRICDLNHNHITLRKLFMLIANMILGYDGEKRIFNSCQDAIEYFKTPNKKSIASFYNNIFGDNLSKSKQEETPFKELRELRIGYETTNNIDNFILFGDIEKDEFYKDKLINPFFNFNAFSRVKEAYLSDNEEDSELKEFLIFLRRHLFFNLSEEMVSDNKKINYSDLITYKYAKKFYENIIIPLKNSTTISKSIIKELALGLNRVFLGELLSKDGNDRLYIATSLTTTTSKLSSEVIGSINFNDMDINQGIHLSLINGFDDEYCRVILEIEFASKRVAKLDLDLYMFEFLERIADGILPTSFSIEYYERILTFKSQILNYMLKNKKSNLTFKLFKLNDLDGTLQFKEIEVSDSDVRES